MTGIKPICPTCRKKSISLFRKTQNIREFVAYYCENCNKIIDPIERLDTIIHRQDIRDFLTSHKKTYNLILADPPWHYTINSLPQNRQVENHYDTMSTDELCNLPVQNIAKVPSILFMWCPNAKKDDALKVLQSWGFRYVTKLTWIKTARNGQPRIGLGNNVRNTSEDILIGKIGDFPMPKVKFSSTFMALQTDHSRKPARSYEMIENMYPDASRIELFARYVHPGWTGVGNESEPLPKKEPFLNDKKALISGQKRTVLELITTEEMVQK